MPYFNGKFLTDRESRSKRKADNNLGITSPDRSITGVYRRSEIEECRKYIKNCQYDHLSDWDTKDISGNPLPLKLRKPRIIYNLGKRLSHGLASKLLGPRVFPNIELDEDPMTEELTKILVRLSGLKSKMLDMARDLPCNGSGFIRFKFTNGYPVIEKYNSNICYPEFDEIGNLKKVEIKYVYPDHKDKDSTGNPKRKWFKMELNQVSDILYDNPEYKSEEEPVFQVVSRAAHNLGFVQGEWFKTGDDPDHPDGPSFIHEILGFLDAFNYSISQSDQAIKYNQEPQLVMKGIDQEELETLIKSSMNAWNLGRDGEANFLETGLGGVERASELRNMFKQNVSEITRVVLLDPEKLVGNAQSAKAMEVLHGPLLDIIDELRPFIERSYIKLIQKITLTAIYLNSVGVQVAGLTFPAGYSPISLNYEIVWPQVFPMTMTDLQQKVSIAAQATQANLISRYTMTKWLAKEFGVEDIDAEVNEVNNQPQLGGFGFF